MKYLYFTLLLGLISFTNTSCKKEPNTTTSTSSSTRATQCTAYTNSGGRCRRTTTNVSGRCWQHN